MSRQLLSKQEPLGCESSDQKRPFYVAWGRVPRWVDRSVSLVNHGDEADEAYGWGFDPLVGIDVRFQKGVVRAFLLWLVANVVLGAGGNILAMALAAVLASIIVRPLKLLLGQTLVEWLASHVFGTPAQPRLYIEQALAKGQIMVLRPELHELYNAYIGVRNGLNRSERKDLDREFYPQIQRLDMLLAGLADHRLTAGNREAGQQLFSKLVYECREQLEAPNQALKELDRDGLTVKAIEQDGEAGRRAAAEVAESLEADANNVLFKLRWNLPRSE